jgi:hypothetical protein
MCLDRFVSNVDKSEGRMKRGGGGVALDFDAAEAELSRAKPPPTPEELFDREYTRAVFATAIDVLRAECEAHGKKEHFAIFEAYDLADERPTYEALAEGHGIPVTTVTNRLAFARRELRRIVLATLDELTANDDEKRDEARRIFGAGE